MIKKFLAKTFSATTRVHVHNNRRGAELRKTQGLKILEPKFAADSDSQIKQLGSVQFRLGELPKRPFNVGKRRAEQNSEEIIDKPQPSSAASLEQVLYEDVWTGDSSASYEGESIALPKTKALFFLAEKLAANAQKVGPRGLLAGQQYPLNKQPKHCSDSAPKKPPQQQQ